MNGLGIVHPSLLTSSRQMPMGPLTEAQLAFGVLEADSHACLSWGRDFPNTPGFVPAAQTSLAYLCNADTASEAVGSPCTSSL
eukprot:14648213-Heterocapsa_arctica.AAC.1